LVVRDDRHARKRTQDDPLSLARAYARDNLVAAMVGPVPLPAGAAEEPFAWQEHDPLPYRAVFGLPRAISTSDGHVMTVETTAIKFSDGLIGQGGVEGPAVYIDDCRSTVAQARQVAAALIAGADELDRLI
jgi:hypothetical protein